MKIAALREILEQYSSSDKLTTGSAHRLNDACKDLGLDRGEIIAVMRLVGYCDGSLAPLAKGVHPIWLMV